MTKAARFACIFPSLLVLALGACGGGSKRQGVGRNDACEEPGVACTWLGLRGDEGFDTGFNGDGHHRLETKTAQVQDLLFLSDGTVWFSDFNNFLIRKVLPDDTVTTVVGPTEPIFPGDGPPGGIPPEGAPGEQWQLNHPTNLLLQDDGDILLVGWHNHKLLNIAPDTGRVRVICGSGAGFAGDGEPCADGALFKQPNDAVLADDGNLYIVDQQNQRIRKLDSEGIITTIAGTGEPGFSGDGGPAIDAEFHWGYGSNPNPSGGITSKDGILYVADTLNHRVRTIDLSTGLVDTLAGNGEPAFAGDGGPASEASLYEPRDLEIGPDGDVYVADTNNGAIRAIDLETNEIRTVVGTGRLGVNEVEALPATETMLRRPMGLAFDPDGNLFVVDSLNDRIVRVLR